VVTGVPVDRFDAAGLVTHTVRGGQGGGAVEQGGGVRVGGRVGEQDVGVGGVEADLLQRGPGGCAGAGEVDVPQRIVEVSRAAVSEGDLLLGDCPVLGFGELVECVARGEHDPPGVAVVAFLVEGSADPQQCPGAVPAVEAIIVGELKVSVGGGVEPAGHLIDDREGQVELRDAAGDGELPVDGLGSGVGVSGGQRTGDGTLVA
jgi:hypothetical protein